MRLHVAGGQGVADGLGVGALAIGRGSKGGGGGAAGARLASHADRTPLDLFLDPI